MKQFDTLNPVTHNGYLPVRVLGYNFIDWFLNITPDFKDEFEYEVTSNGLKQSINYIINREPIRNIAHIKEVSNFNEQGGIDKSFEIEVFENFNQFLWACSYSFFVIFDEGIQKPTLNGSFKGNFLNTTNPFIRKAIEIFKTGLSLHHTYREDVFYRLPNPEKYNEYDQFYVVRSSGIYTAAMTFILLHEFGHQFIGHVHTYSDDEQSKKDEIQADEYAFEKMETKFKEDEGYTLKCGILVGICSLIFSDNTLRGGNRHPDPENRLMNLIEKMDLPDLDNLWAIAALPFNLWAISNNKQLSYTTTVEHYKELFIKTIEQLDELKEDKNG